VSVSPQRGLTASYVYITCPHPHFSVPVRKVGSNLSGRQNSEGMLPLVNRALTPLSVIFLNPPTRLLFGGSHGFFNSRRVCLQSSVNESIIHENICRNQFKRQLTGVACRASRPADKPICMATFCQRALYDEVCW